MQKERATSSDILGQSKRTKIDPKWAPYFRHLINLRDKFLQHKQGLSEVAKQEQESFSLHMADAGTDQYDQAYALSMMSSDQNVLYEIEMALNRIRSGTYGICEVSGKEIEPERLEAIPWARFSVESQNELEEKRLVGRTRLSQAKSIFDGAGDNQDAEDEDEEVAA